MTVLKVNESATEWYRTEFRNHSNDITVYSPEVAECIRNGQCVCCSIAPDGTCPEGHNLCRRCAEYHGCIACGLMG